ncbi:MAG: hypothetical protein DRN49_06520, partial [Thaumarchaeota archaeon]
MQCFLRLHAIIIYIGGDGLFKSWRPYVLRMILLVDVDKCTGCRLCELICSIQHYRVFNPRRSRITVIRDDEKGVFIPITCFQCEDPPCMKICPVHAIYRDKNGAVRIDYERCIGC